LIRAWSLIAANFQDWQVKIFGDGDELLYYKLENLIEELGVSNIKLMGATDFLNLEMQKAAIYAMTSETECFPMVLLEAKASGMAIISYDCPHGPKNIIKNNQDGILVPYNEIDIFAHNLSALLKNENRIQEMGKTAILTVHEFSKEKIMKQWNELILNLCKI
jgi:glycosyltransferase involved in cell wall biosynthesis